MMNKAVRHNKWLDSFTIYLEYIIAFLIIFLNASIWSCVEGGFFSANYTLIHFGTSALIVLLAIIFAVRRGAFVKKLNIIWALVCGMCLILSLYSNAGSFLGAIRVFYLPVVSALFLTMFMQASDFWSFIERFTNLILIVAITSLFFWLFGSVLHWIPASGRVSFKWDAVRSASSYFGLYYTPTWQQLALPGFGFLQKNCGIFTETPMYCFLLSNVYCLYRLRPVQKRWVKTVLLATILSAVNTTAIVAVIAFECIRAVFQGKLKRRSLLKIFVMLILAFVGLYVINVAVKNKLNSGSGEVRMDHLRSCLQAFVSSFPLGQGIASTDAVVGLGEYEQGISMGFPFLFAQEGLGAVILILVPAGYLFVKALGANNWGVIAFLFAFMWSLFCTAVTYRCSLYWIILFYFFNWGSSLDVPAEVFTVRAERRKRVRFRFLG